MGNYGTHGDLLLRYWSHTGSCKNCKPMADTKKCGEASRRTAKKTIKISYTLHIAVLD